MNEFVIILKLQTPAGFTSDRLTQRLDGASIATYGDGLYVGQIMKVVDVIQTNKLPHEAHK